MKESIGYTVSLNIMIVFITIIVAFLCAALIYFKSNKASNVITSAIEEYEGYNDLSIAEINRHLTSLGYNKHSIEGKCTDEPKVVDNGATSGICTLTTNSEGKGNNGYCVYECFECKAEDVPIGSTCQKQYSEYFYYKIRTNMILNVPIINDILDIPIYSNTNRLYNFER